MSESEVPQETRPDGRGVVSEIAVIVLSILIAFSLDAWWDSSVEARRHRQNLEGLRAEFDASVTLIDDAIGRLEVSLESAESLLELTGPQPPAVDTDSVTELVSAAINLWTLELPTVALDGMLATGGVELIENDRLRALVGGWPALVLDVREGYEWMRTERDEVWEPIIGEHVPLRDILFRVRESAPPSRFSADVRALLADPRFENRLAERIQSGLSTKEELGTLRTSAEKVLQLIDQELD